MEARPSESAAYYGDDDYQTGRYLAEKRDIYQRALIVTGSVRVFMVFIISLVGTAFLFDGLKSRTMTVILVTVTYVTMEISEYLTKMRAYLSHDGPYS